MSSISRARARLQSQLSHLKPVIPITHSPIISRTQHRMSSSSSTSPNSPPTSSVISELERYSACDIADALLKLEPSSGDGAAPRAGFLADIAPRVPAAHRKKVMAPVYTVLFRSKQQAPPSDLVAANIPKGAQWSDLVARDAVVVVSQPPGQRCAAVGGHHASRIAALGARALLVDGRVRDVADMGELGLPVWARGTSVVGAGAEAAPHAVQVPVTVDGVTIRPGDWVFCDPEEGAVRIPQELVLKVLDFLPKHAESEAKVKEMIKQGASVQEAFAKCR